MHNIQNFPPRSLMLAKKSALENIVSNGALVMHHRQLSE